MIKGFHVCKAGNAPSVGQVKSLIVNGDRIKSKKVEEGGQNYTIVSVTPRESYSDSYGNVGYDIAIEPQNGAPQAQVATQRAGNGRDDARHYMMRAANLLKLCHDAARAVIGDDYDGEDARTLFIASSREGYIKEMPDKPANGTPSEPEPEPDLPPEHEEEEF